MLRYLLLACCLWPALLHAQSAEEQSIQSKITQVKVFQSGAQVTRVASLRLPFGESQLRLAALSPYIDASSVRVRLRGSATLLAVQHEINYLNELATSAKADSLYSQSKQIDLKIKLLKARLDVLSRKEGLLETNQDLGGERGAVPLADLQAAVGFYETELTAIYTEKLELKDQILELQKALAKINGQLTLLEVEGSKETGEVLLKVDMQQAGELGLEVDYLVQNAGWVPKYDIRVQDVTTALALHCKADVYQNTGVDWQEVQLVLSNANPSERGEVPVLAKWELNYKR